MKSMILIFAVFPIVLFSQTATKPTSANVLQEQSRVNSMNEIMKRNTSSQMLYYKPSELDIKGSKYFNDAYVEGEIWFVNGQYVSTEYVYKFDESQNSVQIKNKAGEEILVDANTINGCKLVIDGKSVIYFRGQVPNNPDKHKLFQLVYNSDKYRIIKLPSKKLIPKTKIFHDDAEQFEYMSEHTFYLKENEGRYKEIKLNKKSIMATFPAKKVTLERLFELPEYKVKLNETLLYSIMTEVEK